MYKKLKNYLLFILCFLVLCQSLLGQNKPKKKSSPADWGLMAAWNTSTTPTATDTAWFGSTSGPCSLYVSSAISTLLIDNLYGQKITLLDTVKLKLQKDVICKRNGIVTMDFKNGEIEFYGSENAVIDNIAPVIKIRKLRINKSSGATVTLINQSVQCDTLILDGGTLQTGSYKIIVGDSTSGKPGVIISNGGFMEGTISLIVTTSSAAQVAIPLVQAGLKREIKLNNFSGSFGPSNRGKLEISFVNTAPGDNGLPLVENGRIMTTASSDGFWRITKVDDILSASYDISITAENFSGISDFANITILKRSSSIDPWTAQGTHETGTGSNSLPTAHRTSLTDFSEFAISQGSPPTPLPIELIKFKAIGKNLVWEISNPEKISSFTISHSIDLLNWEQISEIIPNLAFTYSQTVDKSGFYRLKINEIDGSETISILEIEKSSFDKTSTATIKGKTLDVNCPDETEIMIMSYSGVTLLEQKTQGSALFDLSHLSTGIYILRIGEEKKKIFLE